MAHARPRSLTAACSHCALQWHALSASHPRNPWRSAELFCQQSQSDTVTTLICLLCLLCQALTADWGTACGRGIAHLQMRRWRRPGSVAAISKGSSKGRMPHLTDENAHSRTCQTAAKYTDSTVWHGLEVSQHCPNSNVRESGRGGEGATYVKSQACREGTGG